MLGASHIGKVIQMKNTLKEKLQNHQQPIGTFFELGSANVAEALGKTGLDFIIIDNEHGPFEAESTLDYVRGALLGGVTPLARVREISRPAVLKLLDIGVHGLIVPDVHTVEQVQELVNYAKYAPIGKRGFCPTRKDCWGFAYPGTESVPVNMAVNNAETLLIPQCETVGCLENIETITAMEGVDGIFIGPFDLSISMGIPGQFDHPDFQAALKRVLEACHKNGKFCIYFTVNPDAIADGFQLGFDAMAYGLDAAVLVQAYRNILAKVRG